MANEKQYLSRSAIIAIAVHVLIFTLFIIGFEMRPEASQALVDPVNIVEAEVIDGQAIEDEQRRIREQQEARERQRKAEELRKQREAEEKKRKEEEARQRAEEQRLAEIKQAQEEKRLAEEQRKQAEEAKEQAELERKLAEEERLRAEQERQEAEEKARLLAEQLKKEEEAKKQAELEAEQKRLDDILQQEEAELREAEEARQRAARQRELNTLLSQYVGAIKSKIQRNWRKPPSMESARASCEVYVVQSVGGYIQKVQVQKCRGGDAQFRKSVEEAVLKSDPLPNPPDDELFSRELKFTFEAG